ncbi:MAG: hypothetical protein BWX80_02150 [Candidatus Hydrogenedentes bacterium ADurb.Bin101]|nr:MAG: hypothetical protein BWX80_02150 [Candidatus Hydrogenedentes bacterium ADurb.Bin101]
MLACCGHSGAATLYRQCQRNQTHLAFTLALRRHFTFTLYRSFALAFGKNFTFDNGLALVFGRDFAFALDRSFAFPFYRHPLHRSQAEPDAVAAVVRPTAVTNRRTTIPGVAAPVAATPHAARETRSIYPGAAITRRPRVTIMPVVFAPFIQVTAHVMQPEGIGQLPAYGLRPVTWLSITWVIAAVPHILAADTVVFAIVPYA